MQCKKASRVHFSMENDNTYTKLDVCHERTCTRRTVKNDTSWNLATILGISFGLLQKVYDFGQFQLGTIATSDIVKGDTGIRHHLNLSLAFAKAHGIVGSTSQGIHASSTTSTQKEESGKERCREDETASQVTESTGFLCW